tara:strand:- start:3566 stop:4336 length:771 start_codon:yes stop_codon:yes gene_type:complete
MILIKKKNKRIPKVSIITVTLNSEKYLEKTLQSIKNQLYKNYELIIIDGKSKDKTLKIIKKYKSIISYCVSEKDKGIYDAFNKGMKIARGKYISIVNSDDILTKKALFYLNKYDEENPNIDFLFGSVKKHWGILHGYKPEKINYSWGFYSSHSTGFYIKKISQKKVGLYNIKYKYHADYDFFYRMIVKNKMIGISSKKNEIFGIFRRGGFSSISSFRKKFFEELMIRYYNNQSVFLIFLIAFYKSIFNFRRFFSDK